MLTLFHNNQEIVLDTTEYYVRELASGLDEVIFDLSIWDPNYALLQEEDNIVDRAGQRYLVKQIDAGAVVAKIVCQLDLDDWKASMSVGYNSGTKTVAQQINAVKPAGWSVIDRSGSTIGRTVEGDYTPLQVCERCRDLYSVYIRWDNKTKQCTIYTQAMGSPAGSFATRELNLKEINYKGKSQNFATRLYAYGKDGLSFASINNNKPYVDNNTYSSRIICAYWQDDRYTVAANLLADAQEKLAKLAVPERSYDCAIVDLQATNPELYNNLDFSLFTVATLIDDARNTAIDYQVVERHVWPYHPDRNDVIFNSSPVKIQNSVVQIEDEIINPNSTFSQIWANRVQEATDWLTNGDGYVVALQDANGNWTDTLYMDTANISTAQEVLRINKNGIGFSHNGVNGPYTSAWTIDGKFNADFILAGTINANLMKAGVLADYAGKFSLNMATGALTMNDGTFKGTVQGGSILGGTIGIGGANNDQFTVDSSGNVAIKAGSINLGWDSTNNRYKFSVDNNGNMAAYSGTFMGAISASTITGSSITSVSGSKSTTINGGSLVTNDVTVTGGKITMDTYNYWDLTNKQFMLQLGSGSARSGIYIDSSHFQIFKEVSGTSWNYWLLEDGSFRVGGRSNTSPHISLANDTDNAAFEIYCDSNNYWNLKTGTLKTTHGIFTGSISSTTITGGSIGIGGTNNDQFTVDSSGNVAIKRGSINLGWDSTNSRYNFSVNSSGSLTAYTGTFKGAVSGATITGGTIGIGGANNDQFAVDSSGNVTSKGNITSSGLITSVTGSVQAYMQYGRVQFNNGGYVGQLYAYDYETLVLQNNFTFGSQVNQTSIELSGGDLYLKAGDADGVLKLAAGDIKVTNAGNSYSGLTQSVVLGNTILSFIHGVLTGVQTV